MGVPRPGAEPLGGGADGCRVTGVGRYLRSTALAVINEPAANLLDDTEYLYLLNATGPLIELAVREVGRFSTPHAGRSLPSATTSWR